FSFHDVKDRRRPLGPGASRHHLRADLARAMARPKGKKGTTKNTNNTNARVVSAAVQRPADPFVFFVFFVVPLLARPHPQTRRTAPYRPRTRTDGAS
ncbi:MAG: hypothetical protein ACHP7N_15910, partial [Caulobacterales bacterium]